MTHRRPAAGIRAPYCSRNFRAFSASPFSMAEIKEREMKKYECTMCGYIYDPEVGDPDSGIQPGTAFEDIPDDWVCPVCGAEKSQFEPVG